MATLAQPVYIEHASQWYEDLEAVHDISLTIDAGAFVAVVGPSGCGKTTLLKLIAGLLAPTEGSVHTDQSSGSARYSRGDIGFVFQHPVLLPWRTVRANVELPLELMRQRYEHRREAAVSVLAELGLSEFEDYLPRKLSGGMEQRVALARLLIAKPWLWLLDEPFAALDEPTRLRFGLEVRSLWRQKRPTAVFVTHSIDEAVLLSDRVVILSARPGRILETIDVGLAEERTAETTETSAYVAATQHIRRLLMSNAS